MASPKISNEQLCKKLRKLRNYIPNEMDRIYQFGYSLADRLENKKLVTAKMLDPEHFHYVAESLIFELEHYNPEHEYYSKTSGIDEDNTLLKSSPHLYAVLRFYIPRIAQATCTKTFAEEVGICNRRMIRSILESGGRGFT